jgi:hypothetical protein
MSYFSGVMMNAFHKDHRFRFFIVPLLLCILSAAFFFSCVDESASNNSNDYGSVAISIRLFSESNSQPDESVRRYEMDVDPSCQVHVEVMDGSSVIASGGPWDWSDGSGTVTGVPVGSGRTIVVKINDPTDSLLQYEGEISGITIISGTNDLTDSPIYVYSTDACADFSGYWYVTEYATSVCYGDEVPTSTGSTVIQDGCDVSFNVDEYTGWTDGYVEGNTLFLDPVTFTIDTEVTTYSNWYLIISGDSITGYADWDYYSNYGTFHECSGTSTFSGTRESY